MGGTVAGAYGLYTGAALGAAEAAELGPIFGTMAVGDAAGGTAFAYGAAGVAGGFVVGGLVGGAILLIDRLTADEPPQPVLNRMMGIKCPVN